MSDSNLKSDNIVKIIHFIWVDKYDFANPDIIIPHKYQENIETWKKYNPDYTIKIWNGKQIIDLIINIMNTDIANIFFSYKHFICKVDFAKIIILYMYGGLYVDVDTICYKNITTLLTGNGTLINKSLLLFKEPDEHLKNYKSLGDFNLDKFIICNCFIYSTLHNPLLLSLGNYYKIHQYYENQHILMTTGPVVFNHFYYDMNINIKKNENKNENDKFDKIALLETSDYSTYYHTTYDNTWTTNNTLFTNEIFDNYYYYPCMNLTGFNKILNNSVKLNTKLVIESKLLSFTTENKISYCIPTLIGTQLCKQFVSEYNGTFINKNYFKRSCTIPKIIHQIWLGTDNPPIYIMNTWKTLNPLWEYRLWNEKQLEEEFPYVFESNIYKNLCTNISNDINNINNKKYDAKSDIFRVNILNKYGGIYIDADCKALKPIPDMMCNHTMFVSFQSEREHEKLVNNCVIGSIKNNPILDKILKEWNNYHIDMFNLEIMHLTGPGFYSSFISRHSSEDIFIYPSYYFNTHGNDGKQENTFLAQFSISNHLGRFSSELICHTKHQLLHRDYLGDLLNSYNLDNIGVEIGVQRGLFSQEILRKWNGRKLFLVDAWEKQSSDVYIDTANVSDELHNYNMYITKVLTNNMVSKKIDHLYKTNVELIKKYSVEASLLFEDNSLDFVYIDARHDYKGILEDLHAWYSKVKSGGLVSGHDFIWEQHLEYVKQFGEFGVKEALTDFVRNMNITNTVNITTKDDAPFYSFYFIKP
jgi:mannosyltransferase OCH1-like enzyme